MGQSLYPHLCVSHADNISAPSFPPSSLERRPNQFTIFLWFQHNSLPRNTFVNLCKLQLPEIREIQMVLCFWCFFSNHLTLPHQVKNWCDALSHLNNVFHISCFHLIKQTISTLDPDTVAPRGEEWGSAEKRIWASLSWIDVIVMIQGDCWWHSDFGLGEKAKVGSGQEW